MCIFENLAFSTGSVFRIPLVSLIPEPVPSKMIACWNMKRKDFDSYDFENIPWNWVRSRGVCLKGTYWAGIFLFGSLFQVGIQSLSLEIKFVFAFLFSSLFFVRLLCSVYLNLLLSWQLLSKLKPSSGIPAEYMLQLSSLYFSSVYFLSCWHGFTNDNLELHGLLWET